MLIVMGIGFMAGAGAFILFVPQPTGAIVGAIWLLMGAGFVFFSVRAMRGRRDDERIRRQGTRATATVLGVQMTGLVVNNVPQWALKLRIDGAGASYEAKLKLLTFTPPSDGAGLSVRVDPLKREHVVLSDDGDGAVAVAAPRANGAEPGQGVPDAVVEALRQAGLAAGETAVVNADGSRTITTSSVTVGGTGTGTVDAADMVRLLADLDRMRAEGSLTEAEFGAVKAKLLGGS